MTKQEARRVYDARYRAKHPNADREYYLANRERILARNAAWLKANPDKCYEYGKKHRQSHLERYRAYSKKWADANPDSVRARNVAWYATNRSSERARHSAWSKANSLATAAHCSSRRALRLNAPGSGVTPAQWRELVANALGLCAYCNAHARLTQDHIEPLSEGGAHDIANVAAVCKSCNSAKHSTPLLVWLAKKASLRGAMARAS